MVELMNLYESLHETVRQSQTAGRVCRIYIFAATSGQNGKVKFEASCKEIAMHPAR